MQRKKKQGSDKHKKPPSRVRGPRRATSLSPGSMTTRSEKSSGRSDRSEYSYRSDISFGSLASTNSQKSNGGSNANVNLTA